MRLDSTYVYIFNDISICRVRLILKELESKEGNRLFKLVCQVTSSIPSISVLTQNCQMKYLSITFPLKLEHLLAA